MVNTAVTGPAAAMALMMMYLKTGDADVAARFKVCMCVSTGSRLFGDHQADSLCYT